MDDRTGNQYHFFWAGGWLRRLRPPGHFLSFPVSYSTTVLSTEPRKLYACGEDRSRDRRGRLHCSKPKLRAIGSFLSSFQPV